MPWAIGAGAALGGLFGLMGASEQASAAESAASKQAGAARYASALQYRMWQEQQALMAPWRTSGQNALNELNWQMGLPSGQVPGTTAPTAATPAATRRKRQIVGYKTQRYGPDEKFTRQVPIYSNIVPTGGAKSTDPYGGLKSGTVAPTATKGINALTAAGAAGGYLGSGNLGTALAGRPFIGGEGNYAAMGVQGAYVGDKSDYGVLSERFGMDQYQEDPGYQFRLQQGINALTAAGAAGGYLGSGNLGTALVGYGQEMGSQEYQNAYNRYMAENEAAYNRLAAISGTGQLSSEYLAGAGGTAAANMGNLAVGGANALAAGQTGAANAWAGGLYNIGSQAQAGLGTYLNYQQQQAMIDAWKNSQGISPLSSYSNALVAPSAYDTWSFGGKYTNLNTTM